MMEVLNLTADQAPWRFPDTPNLQTLTNGDLDGDGLADLVADGVVYLGATLGTGGTFEPSDGVEVAGLVDYAGDVDGDGLDDVWLYEHGISWSSGTITIQAHRRAWSAPPMCS